MVIEAQLYDLITIEVSNIRKWQHVGHLILRWQHVGQAFSQIFSKNSSDHTYRRASWGPSWHHGAQLSAPLKPPFITALSY